MFRNPIYAFLFFALTLHAQEPSLSFKNTINESELIDTIFYHIYNQDFKIAEKKLIKNKEKLSYIASNWLLCELKWWKVIKYSENEKLYTDFEIYLEEQLDDISKLSEENKLIEMVYSNYLLRLMSIKNRSFKMFKYFIRINNFLKNFDSTSLKPYEKDLFTIYRAVFIISKNKLHIFSNENEEALINSIDMQTRSNKLIVKTTAQYFIIKIYLEVKDKPEMAKKYIEDFQRQFPKNLIFQKKD